MCFLLCEAYADDECNPIPTREGRAAFNREQLLRKAGVSSRVPLVIPPRCSTPPLQLSEKDVFNPGDIHTLPSGCQSPPVDNQKLAEAIAEALVAPPRQQTNINNMPLRVEIHADEPRRSAEYEEVERRYIEREASRRVKDSNRRVADLQAIEDAARARVENEFRQSFSSLGSTSDSYTSHEPLIPASRHHQAHYHRSKVPRRVTWAGRRENFRTGDIADHQCSNCHNFGHRSRDCKTQVTQVINVNNPSRGQYPPQHPRHRLRPHNHIRYVDPKPYY